MGQSVKLHIQSSRLRLKNNLNYFRRLYVTGVQLHIY